MLCRLCLENTQDYFAIFNENSISTPWEINEIIMKHLQINLLQDDQISAIICHNCWRELLNFHTFYRQIAEKQKTLQKVLCSYIAKSNAPETEQFLGDTFEVRQELHSLLESEITKDNKKCLLTEPQIETPTKEEQIFFIETKEFGAAEVEQTEEFTKIANGFKGKRTSTTTTKREYLRRKTKPILAISKSSPNKKKSKLTDKLKKKEPKNAAVIREMDAYIAEHSPLVCCICEEPLQDFNKLKKHFRLVHQCLGYVMCCNNRYIKRRLFVDHLKVHDKPDAFKCEKCDKILASRGCYYNHMASLHPPEEELKFDCQICKRKFAKQYILDTHMRIHNRVKREHLCTECNKYYPSKAELNSHQKRVHLNGFAVICDICGKNFKSKQNLTRHTYAFHENNKKPEAQCQICQRWLKDEQSLFKHMYKHQDEAEGRQYACSHCGSIKTNRQALKSHIQYHHGNKSFKCTMCDKVFKRARCLEEHIATHTGQDLYSCEFCSQTFKSHANMHNHKRKMHPKLWVRKYTQPSRALSLKNDSELPKTIE